MEPPMQHLPFFPRPGSAGQAAFLDPRHQVIGCDDAGFPFVVTLFDCKFQGMAFDQTTLGDNILQVTQRGRWNSEPAMGFAEYEPFSHQARQRFA